MMIEYLDEAIASFGRDPPDTDFQRGYLAALVEARKQAAATTGARAIAA